MNDSVWYASPTRMSSWSLQFSVSSPAVSSSPTYSRCSWWWRCPAQAACQQEATPPPAPHWPPPTCPTTPRATTLWWTASCQAMMTRSCRRPTCQLRFSEIKLTNTYSWRCCLHPYCLFSYQKVLFACVSRWGWFRWSRKRKPWQLPSPVQWKLDLNWTKFRGKISLYSNMMPTWFMKYGDPLIAPGTFQVTSDICISDFCNSMSISSRVLEMSISIPTWSQIYCTSLSWKSSFSLLFQPSTNFNQTQSTTGAKTGAGGCPHTTERVQLLCLQLCCDKLPLFNSLFTKSPFQKLSRSYNPAHTRVTLLSKLLPFNIRVWCVIRYEHWRSLGHK